jgi:hypothetical protein
LALSGFKEPHYFAADYPRRREIENQDDYDALFAKARPDQLRGDVSSHYLSSKVAIPAILRRRPDAKFIALVRDPVEMFISWHNECVKSLDEDVEDPERAWRLQSERASGALPKLCKEPGYLQYREFCGLGEQIRRLFDLVPPDRRLVILWDDLDRSPATVQKQITDFLGVQDVGLNHFPRENTFASHRSHAVARLVRLIYVHPLVKRLRVRLKPILNRRGVYPLKWAVDRSLIGAAKPTLSGPFREELRLEFETDVATLEKLLDRDLSHWKNSRASSVRHQVS